MEIKFNKKTYKLTDLETEFTLKQQKEARKFLMDIIMSLQSDTSLIDLQSKLQELNNNKEDKNYKNEIAKIDNQYLKIMLNAIANIDYETKVLALLFVEKGKKFDVDEYNKRIEDFDNLPYKEEFDEVISNFFTLKIPSLMKSSLTSLKGIRQINQIA